MGPETHHQSPSQSSQPKYYPPPPDASAQQFSQTFHHEQNSSSYNYAPPQYPQDTYSQTYQQNSQPLQMQPINTPAPTNVIVTNMQPTPIIVQTQPAP
ncbi:1657_t:CDS:1, partial [Acaulospora colombiana]